MHHPDNCLNCDTALNSEYKFCYKCGEPTNTHPRLTMGHIGHEVFHALTHADKGLLYLIKELFIRPGVTIREYLHGRHKKYFNPFSFFFIVLGIYVLSNTFYKPFSYVDPAKKKARTMVYPPSVKTPEARAKYQARYIEISKRADKAIGFMNTKTNIVLFVSTPFIAFIMFVIYRRRINYAENLVVMVFVNTFLILLSILIFSPLMHFAPNSQWYEAFKIMMLATHVIYLGVVYHGVAQQRGSFIGYSKSALSALLGIVVWITLSQAAIRFYIVNGLF